MHSGAIRRLKLKYLLPDRNINHKNQINQAIIVQTFFTPYPTYAT